MRPNTLLQICALLFSLNGFAQFNLNAEKAPEMNFEVRGSYNRFVKKEILNKAESLQDILPGYPDNWITTYVSSEIASHADGKIVYAKSNNHILSKEQKNLIKSCEVASQLTLTVKYKYFERVSQVTENNNIKVDLTVIPDIEAEYAAGYKELINYFKTGSVAKIDPATISQIKRIQIKFTVNESGEITQVKLIKGCGIADTDKLFVDLVSKMPQWRPAQNANGIKVKQQFEFLAGNMLYGC